MEQIKKTVDLQDLRERFVTGDDPTAAYFWDYSIKDARCRGVTLREGESASLKQCRSCSLTLYI